MLHPDKSIKHCWQKFALKTKIFSKVVVQKLYHNVKIIYSDEIKMVLQTKSRTLTAYFLGL